jgi:hypothetical protein
VPSPSHAGDGTAGMTLAAARCRCRVMLAFLLSSHVGDGIAEVTWPRHDVDAESC